MAYPSLDQYNEAFQAHSRLLTDPELRAGTVATTGMGLPLAISGGFALTYTIKAAKGKYAVRCFHRAANGIERRYSAISKRLASLRSPYFVAFEFQPKGIHVGSGGDYPIVKMAWADGETLGQFLEANHAKPAALAKLADAISALAEFLTREGIAHGDLQPGNLMVSAGGSSLQLIDYDGMYVDEIKDLGSAEIGHVNFQHPARKSANPFGPDLDRFSLIGLALALKALRVDPSLWRKTNSEVDALLFRANDFADPGSSAAFALLGANGALAMDAKHFAAVCKAPIDKVPSLPDFFAGKNVPPAQIVLSGLPKPNAQKAGYISAYEVLAATDFAACLRRVGDMVEVIGRVTDVKEDRAKNGKPYVFINFGDWRGDIFKLAIWSEGLATIKSRPDASWVGKWLSVTGLMEPIYKGRAKSGSYRHLSINITGAGQFSIVGEAEARWRLAGPSATPRPAASASNSATLDRIAGRQSPAPPRPAAGRPSVSPNQAIIDKIRATQPAGQRAAPPPAQPHRQRPSAPPASQEGVVTKVLKWLFG